MDAVLQWGLDVIYAVQQFQSPLLNTIINNITHLGSGMLLLFIVPLFVWCVDFRLGMRVMVVCYVAGFCNMLLKDVLMQPRPFDLDPAVRIGTAGGYGLPSGHSQGSLVLFGSLALWLNRRWFWLLSIAIIVLVGFSRVYLGVHFPTDVLGGWAVGLGFLYAYMVLCQRIEHWITRQSLGVQVLLSLALSLGLLLIYTNSITLRTMGMLAGAGTGAALKGRRFPFTATGPWVNRLLRYLVGIGIMVMLLMLLRWTDFAWQAAFYSAAGCIQFVLIGLWITIGAPYLFRLLRL